MSDIIWGDLLRVNLSTGKVEREAITDELKMDFIGARGINSKILYDEVGPGVDPLSSQNVLIFGSGPLNGTYLPGSGRWTVTAKSPLSQIHGDGNAGGHWGTELRFAGISNIVIYGKSHKPVYLAIDDDKVEIRPAEHLWGKDTWETQRLIKDWWGDSRVQVATIGQAGENLVRYASINNSITKAVGRTGMGAVMGSKNLKAIAVRGTKGVRVAKPEQFREAALEVRRLIMTHPSYKEFQAFGTPGIIDSNYDAGETGAFYHRQSRFEGVDYVGADNAKKKVAEYTVGHSACFACPLGCMHHYLVKEGPYTDTFGHGPEATHIGCIGLNCGIRYYPAILKISTTSNLLGIDALDLGNVIAFAMSCYHRGMITKEDTDGVDLDFGNYEAVLKMTEKIASREGFGDILAEGTEAFARRLGPEAEYLTATVNGMGFLAGEWRSQPATALSFATSTRGADHMRGYVCTEVQGVRDVEVIKERFGVTELPPRTSYTGKPQMAIWQQHFNAVQDIVPSCRFTGEWSMSQRIQPKHYAAALSAATGIYFSGDALMRVAERVYNVERAFNCREGKTRDNDSYPRRFFEEPTPDGPMKGAVLDRNKFEKMKDEYYELRGWDVKTGIPTREKLRELGLKYIADDLEATKRRK